MEANLKSDKTLIMIFNYNCDTADILDLSGWIRNFAIRKFAKFHTFLISRNFANNFQFYFAKFCKIRNEFLVRNFVSRNFVSTLGLSFSLSSLYLVKWKEAKKMFKAKQSEKTCISFRLKRQSHEIFDLWFFRQTSSPRPLFSPLKCFRK
jgi:hypothetical protein